MKTYKIVAQGKSHKVRAEELHRTPEGYVLRGEWDQVVAVIPQNATVFMVEPTNYKKYFGVVASLASIFLFWAAVSWLSGCASQQKKPKDDYCWNHFVSTQCWDEEEHKEKR